MRESDLRDNLLLSGQVALVVHPFPQPLAVTRVRGGVRSGPSYGDSTRSNLIDPMQKHLTLYASQLFVSCPHVCTCTCVCIIPVCVCVFVAAAGVVFVRATDGAGSGGGHHVRRGKGWERAALSTPGVRR